ncbi:adenosine receptor A2a-like [Oculina patagonica]
MINFTSHRSEETIQFSACSVTIADSEEAKCVVNFRFLVSVNVILSITSLLGNILILTALQKETSLHPPSKLLFRCLSCTDLCVGLISQPLYIFYVTMIANKNWNLCGITESLAHMSSAILCGESINTLTAISVDRLLALLLRLRYRHIVTLTRVRLFVVVSWFMSFAFALTYLWNKRAFFIGSCVWLLLCLSISSCCYLKIYVSLRRQQAQVHGSQVHPGASVNITWYKKTVDSALWINLTLVLCYLPYTIATAVSILHSLCPCSAIAWNITGILVFVNSSLNPVLYCWKLREVRQAVKQTIRQFICLS